MNFTATMPLKELEKNHPLYDGPKRIVDIPTMQMYLSGGETFNISDQLWQRPIEASGDPIGTATRTARIQTAFYNNYLKHDLVDIASQVVKVPLTIDDDQEREYWEQLDTCFDGNYTSATQTARETLMQYLPFGRGYYGVRFPDRETGDGATLGDQLASSDLDAQIIAIDAASINDWEFVPNHVDLKYARQYQSQRVRAGDFGPYNAEKKSWTYYTTDQIVTYSATKLDDEGQWPDIAKITEIENHQLGVCPIFAIPQRCCVGGEILPCARQIFNKESNRDYLEFSLFTGGGIIFCDNKAECVNIALTPFGFPVLPFNARMERDKVDAALFTSASQSISELRSSMKGIIREMARQMGSQSQSGQNTSRASGKMLEKSEDPFMAWIASFGQDQISTIRRVIRAIAAMRDEDDEDIHVSGLCEMNIEESSQLMTMDRMTAETAFAALPNVSKEAKDAHGLELALEVCVDCDEETLDKIKIAKIPEPEPKPIVAGVKPSVGNTPATKLPTIPKGKAS